MIAQEKQISLKQALLLYIMLLGSFSITFLSNATVNTAGEAAWISPFVALGLFTFELVMFQYIFNKYGSYALIDILKDVLGKALGTAVGVFLVIWFTHYVSAYVYDYSTKITMSIFPNINKMIFIIVILLLTAYVLRSGIVVIARMNEIFFIIVASVFLLLNLLIIPQMKITNFYPLTYQDIIPVFKSGFYITGMYCQILIIFAFSDRISGKDKLFKSGVRALLFNTLLVLLVIAIPLGIFGPTLAAKMPMPFFSAVKQISLFETVERLDSGVVMVWILTDLIVILLFSFAGIHMMKSLFKLNQPDNYINIYLLIIFLTCLFMYENMFEDQLVVKQYTLYLNNFMGVFLPLLIIVVGKIRKRL